jgi:hypothetical protein
MGRGAVLGVLAALLSSVPATATARKPELGPIAEATTDVRGSGVLLLGAAAPAMAGAEASVGFGPGPFRLYVGGMGLSGPSFDLGPGSLRPVIVAANVDLCVGAYAVDLYSRLCLGGTAGSEHVAWKGFATPNRTLRPWGGARLGYAYTRWLTPQLGLEGGADIFVPVVATRYQARLEDDLLDTRSPWRVGVMLRIGLVFRTKRR